MDEHGRIDCGSTPDRARLDRRAAESKRPLHVYLPAAMAHHRAGDFQPLVDRHAAGVAAADEVYLLGSATTMAMASPFGDTARREIAPSWCGAPSNTSLHAGAPRVHDMILVPLDITIVLPSGSHA